MRCGDPRGSPPPRRGRGQFPCRTRDISAAFLTVGPSEKKSTSVGAHRQPAGRAGDHPGGPSGVGCPSAAPATGNGRPGTGESTRRLHGHVELQNIGFGYNPLDKPLLTGFDLTVGPGQQVALVGGSGSGKSTVSRLIAGLYTPWEGVIRIDGQRLEDIPRGALAASVSFVDQDVFLFEGTVRDNVALWDPSIPDEAVVEALRDAALYDVVMRRPGGIHSRVEQDGRNFSGGQRQRLEIARALVRRPSILVLDEVTSALDAETELVVMDNLRRRGCACVVIAHRLSTVRDSDEIVVLQHGTVVERGRHEELVARGGAYAALVRER